MSVAVGTWLTGGDRPKSLSYQRVALIHGYKYMYMYTPCTLLGSGFICVSVNRDFLVIYNYILLDSYIYS